MNHEQFCHWLAGYLDDTEAAIEWGKTLRAELAKVLVGAELANLSGGHAEDAKPYIFPDWIPYSDQQRYAAERLKTQQAMAEQMRDMPLPSPGPRAVPEMLDELSKPLRQRVTELELLCGKLETRVRVLEFNAQSFNAKPMKQAESPEQRDAALGIRR